jgi:hypothetical protein
MRSAYEQVRRPSAAAPLPAVGASRHRRNDAAPIADAARRDEFFEAASSNEKTMRGTGFDHDFSQVPVQSGGAPGTSLQFFLSGSSTLDSGAAFPVRSDPLESEADYVARHGMAAPASDSGVREHIGRLLGCDFSGVRLHSESTRAEALGAHGFAQGQDVHLAPGRFRPDLPFGRALIAHELAHVVQQGAAPHRPFGPGHFRTAVAGLGQENASARLARSADTLRDTNPKLSSAPLGMQQRCVAGCKSSSESDRKDAGAASPTAQPATQPTHAVGPPAAKAGAKIVRLAWTVDDGPTSHTPAMNAKLSPRAASWFVMSNQLGKGADRAAALKGLEGRQKAGDEIAIHSMHPDVAHSAWFPISLDGVAQGYKSTSDAMKDLTAFTTELRGASLNVHFARMPGGEISEVEKYVKKEGGSSGTSRSVAQALLSGSTPSPAAPPTVAADVSLVMQTLKTLKLHLWDGSASGPELRRNTWEAESSGVPARTNDVATRFEGVVNQLASGARTTPASFVILAHDTTAADVAMAEKNIGLMEAYAISKGVRVEYYTMASLYQTLRGAAP